MLCIVALRVGVQDKKLYQHVPSRQLLYDVSFSHKTQREKNESKKMPTCVFEAHNQACTASTGRVTFCYSLNFA